MTVIQAESLVVEGAPIGNRNAAGPHGHSRLAGQSFKTARKQVGLQRAASRADAVSTTKGNAKTRGWAHSYEKGDILRGVAAKHKSLVMKDWASGGVSGRKAGNFAIKYKRMMGKSYGKLPGR